MITFSDDHNFETFCLIWLDVEANNSEKYRNKYQQLRHIINYVKTFQDSDKCQEYIQQVSEDDRIVLMISDRWCRKLVPHIHQYPQVSSIYVYYLDKQIDEQWTQEFTKVAQFRDAIF